jgi:hypothetical protein
MWPRDPFVEAEVPEQAEGGGEALLAVPSLVLDVGERGELCRCSLGRHRRELSLDPRASSSSAGRLSTKEWS